MGPECLGSKRAEGLSYGFLEVEEPVDIGIREGWEVLLVRGRALGWEWLEPWIFVSRAPEALRFWVLRTRWVWKPRC